MSLLASPILLLTLLLGLAILVWGVMAYNALVRGGLRVDEAWSTVAVQLKRRASLVPNLVETVAGYAAHERETLETVARARRGLDAPETGPQAAQAANAALSQVLGRLLAVAEQYPDLKASTGFLKLQGDLADLEEKIAYGRQFYNRAVLDLNSQIATLPASIIARAMNLRERAFFEMDEPPQTPRVTFRPLEA